jgi:hypothetical protein
LCLLQGSTQSKHVDLRLEVTGVILPIVNL